MPGLAEVLNDPNYVNANAATKAAIFDKFSASDTNFTGANPETQQAIRVKFGLTAPSQPRTLLSQIPGAENAPAPKVETKPSLYQRVLGAAEVPLRVGLGAITEPIAGAAGVLGTLTSGAFGTQEGIRRGQDIQQRVRQLNQPTTETGAQNLQAVGQVLEPLMGVPIPTMNALAQGVAAPLRMGTNALRAAAEPVEAGLQRRQNTIAAGKVAESYQNAPKIEAAQTAQKLGLALNPSISNPTATTRAISAIGGREASTKLAEGNVKQLTNVIKQDLGDTTPGVIAPGAFEDALDTASAPYNVVREMPTLEIPNGIAQKLTSIPKPALIGGESSAAAVTALVDEALAKLRGGRSGALVLDDIRQARREAQVVYKARDSGSNPKPSEVSRADAQMQIANVLEDLIDANAPVHVLPELKAARVKMAQIYDHERAFDPATNQIDPQVYAKLLRERKGAMTGLPADIGRVAANYPEVMQILPAEEFVAPRMVRGGVGATTGLAIGNLIAPGVGAIPGVAIGAMGGAVAGNLAARRMASPAFQAKYAMPPDYRAPVANALAPTQNLPVPYTSPGAYLPGRDPNWVFGRSDPNLQTGIPPGAPQLTAPSAEGTMARVAQQRAYELTRDRAAAAQAEQDIEAWRARNRQPTGRGTLLDFDPITGRLRNASQGMVGATPDTIESAGATLQNAIAKLTGTPTRDIPTQFSRVRTGRVDAQGAPTFTVRGKETTTYDTGRVYPEGTPKAGQPVYETIERTGPNTSRGFALTAEEKIAWDKTRVDLADAVPGFNKLSDKAILGKMQDRAWVADAIQKARDQAKGFEAIARRSNDQIVSARADAQRARMMDLAESLEESLRARPVEIKNRSQGPKTRAARRNELAPEDAVIVTPSNALRP